jgi:segregation and condensation protein A
MLPVPVPAGEPSPEDRDPLEAGAQELWELGEAPPLHAALVVSLDGFEGPLDVLLALARTQRVDIAKISVLALAEQYLHFIAQAQRLKLELAADYLVMAAWLAYLKSKLLLPREANREDEVTGEVLAARLAFRLRRLEAMRTAAAALMTRHRLGRDVFGRGMPEGVRTIRVRQYTAEVFDLLKAYAEQRRRVAKRVHVVERRKVWSIREARELLERFMGTTAQEWIELDAYLARYARREAVARTALASSFGATLELAREGLLELSQAEAFAPLYVRRRQADTSWQRAE